LGGRGRRRGVSGERDERRHERRAKDETTGAKARHGDINLPCGGWFDQIVR
jgi:hypothetical protein